MAAWASATIWSALLSASPDWGGGAGPDGARLHPESAIEAASIAEAASLRPRWLAGVTAPSVSARNRTRRRGGALCSHLKSSQLTRVTFARGETRPGYGC